jgi:PAS domain S-box-containing protein
MLPETRNTGAHEGVSQPLVQASLLGEAIDGGPVLVFVADEEMRYVAANRYACEVLGYRREELLGLQVTDVVPGSGTDEQYAEFVRDGFMAGTTSLTRKDGSTVRFSYRATTTTVANLDLFVSVGTLVDD